MPESSVLSAPLHDYIGLSDISSSAPPLPPPPDAPDLSLDLGLGLSLSASASKDKRHTAVTTPTTTSTADQAPLQQQQIDQAHKCSLPEFLAMPAQPKNGAAKRGYTDAISTVSEARYHSETASRDAEPGLETKPAVHRTLPPHPPQQQKQQQPSFLPTWAPAKPTVPSWHSVSMEKSSRPPFKPENASTEASADVPPPPKDRVVGWPPVRSYRRQTLAKPAEMFVKVNMDGIAVGRKVDLHSYASYEGLLRALQDMFQPSNTGGAMQGACPAPPGREKNFLLSAGSEFVLTYEDKDGDWMLVGDVPWSMFISTVKRLRITRRSESTAPVTAVSRGTDNSRFAAM